MNPYEDLIERLRYQAAFVEICGDAADALVELQKQVEDLTMALQEVSHE